MYCQCSCIHIHKRLLAYEIRYIKALYVKINWYNIKSDGPKCILR